MSDEDFFGLEDRVGRLVAADRMDPTTPVPPPAKKEKSPMDALTDEEKKTIGIAVACVVIVLFFALLAFCSYMRNRKRRTAHILKMKNEVLGKDAVIDLYPYENKAFVPEIEPSTSSPTATAAAANGVTNGTAVANGKNGASHVATTELSAPPSEVSSPPPTTVPPDSEERIKAEEDVKSNSSGAPSSDEGKGASIEDTHEPDFVTTININPDPDEHDRSLEDYNSTSHIAHE